ncbi:MAG: hypothetical protein FJ119_09615 [Deltaproteobacteria bacterium]|nr:hypothetical protein [Deltaproteobacteria bacterium]
MANLVLTTNEKMTCSYEYHIQKLAKKATRADLFVAFFTDNKLIKTWLKQKMEVNLCVSLRPPTNPYTLQEVYHICDSIKYLGKEFHSKICIFYSGSKIIGAVVGSSNMTQGGLLKNIETNIVTSNPDLLNALANEVKRISEISSELEPEDIQRYILAYEASKKQRKAAENIFSKFKFRKRKSTVATKQFISKTAKKYLAFWRAIDEVSSLVKAISEREWPGIPVYLTIDHFWHWLVKVRYSDIDKPISRSAKWREQNIPQLFLQYSKWDKTNGNWTIEFQRRSTAFRRMLRERRIDSLTKNQFAEIYAKLNSGYNSAARFQTHVAFVNENNLPSIRKALKYLLYSSDDITLRISALLRKNGSLKLKYFGPSNVQELLGWVHCKKMPMRNEKATKGAQLLGYNL